MLRGLPRLAGWEATSADPPSGPHSALGGMGAGDQRPALPEARRVVAEGRGGIPNGPAHLLTALAPALLPSEPRLPSGR